MQDNVTITVGDLSVTLRETSALASIGCGRVSLDVSHAAGRRFFDELSKIREVLLAAHAVLTQRALSGHATTTPAEVHLASRLVELEISPDWARVLEKLTQGEVP